MHRLGIQPYVYGAYFEKIKDHIEFKSPIDVYEDYNYLVRQRVDAVVSLGGDGTMLDTVMLVRDSGTPIMGINLGRLGFLSSIGKEQIPEVEYAAFWGCPLCAE